MKVEVTFEDSEHVYTVDFIQLAQQLHITEEQVKQAVNKVISKS